MIAARCRRGGGAAGVPFDECLSYIRHDINRQYSLARSGLSIPQGGASRMELLRDPFVRSVSRRITANKRAMLSYKYTPYSGRVTLFRAQYDPYGHAEKDPSCGWQAYAEGGVDIHVVPGNHFVLLREPFVETLAAGLEEALEKATSSDAP